MNRAKPQKFIVFFFCVLMAAACTNDGKTIATRSPVKSQSSANFSRTESPDPRAVVDSGPYWCDMVPKEAFRRVTGIAGNIVEYWGARSLDNGTCIVEDQEEYGPLGVGWLTDGARNKISSRMDKIHAGISNKDFKRLPSQLGFGFTAYAPSELRSAPYVAAAVFRCGGREISIDIDLRRVSKGRDATKDLTDLMRIAQQRFGKIHHCVPRP